MIEPLSVSESAARIIWASTRYLLADRIDRRRGMTLHPGACERLDLVVRRLRGGHQVLERLLVHRLDRDVGARADRLRVLGAGDEERDLAEELTAVQLGHLGRV